MNIISYGGGVQTVALIILNSWNHVQPKATHAVFADTGSEMPETLDHINNTMLNWSNSQGIPIEIVQSKLGPLHEYVEKGNAVMPMYGDKGGMTFRRCTDRWKITQVRRWLRSHGAKTATVQIGISLDEAHRMKDSPRKWITHSYPLVDMGYTRQDCINLIKDEGLPVPPRSACWMCPYRRLSEWKMMKLNNPREFNRAVELERKLDGLYLHSKRKPLDLIVGEQLAFPEEDECGGYCWT